MIQLGFTIEETWLTRMGFLLDLQACHMQFNGWAKPKIEATIDDVFPI